MVNPVKNNPWYMNIIGVVDYMNSDKMSIDAIDKGEYVTQEELDSAIKKAKKITPFGEKDKSSKGIIDHFKELFIKHDNPNEDVLYKENKNIPQSEIDRASKYAWFEGKDKNLNKRISRKVGSWYDEVFGKENAVGDAVGKLISPQAKYPLPKEIIPLLSKDGKKISDSYNTLASVMAKHDAKKPVLSGSLSLQQALNKFPYQPQLKEDGVIGVRTTSWLKQVLAEQGLSSLLKYI